MIDHTVPARLAGVLAWTRHALREPVPETPPPDAPALTCPRFRAELARHRLVPWLARRLPAAQAAPLLPAASDNLRRSLARVAELRHVGDRLDASGVPWLVVKGPALASRLWGHPTQRHAGDLDIVVPPGDVRRVDAMLREDGYVRTDPDFELSPRQREAYSKIKYEMAYRSPRHPDLYVELKWRLDGIDRLDQHLRTPERTELAGRSIPVLPRAVEFRYLCGHGARHGWFRLFWLVDVARLLGDPELDCSAVLPGGERDPAWRSVAQACRLARELLGVTPSGGFLALAENPAPVARRLAAAAIVELASPPPARRPVRFWFRQLRYRLQLASGAAEKWAVCRPHLFSPHNWRMLRLPDSLFPLYPLLGPFLWLVRLLKRAKGAREDA